MRYLITFVILLIASTSWANPFLVCDPTPEAVTHYGVTVDGVDEVVPSFDCGDGTVRLMYDCEGFSPGAHHIEVRAINLWGESDTVPFDCVKVLPSIPSGIGLSAK